MSARAQQYVLALRGAPIGTPERLLLMVLAFHYSDIEECARPSVATLMEETGLSEQRIHELLKALTGKGLLAREGKGGAGITSRYVFPSLLKGQNSLTLADGEGSEFSDGLPEKGQNSLTLADGEEEKRVRILVPPPAKRVREFVVEGQKGSENSDPKEYTRKSTGDDERVRSPSLPSVATETTARAAQRAKKPKALTPEYLEVVTLELIDEYAGIWTAEQVRAIVGRALNHKASTKWLNKERGLRDWLRRDAEQARAGPATTPPRNGTGSGPPPPAKEVTAVFRTASVEEIRARRLAREAQQQGAQSP